MNIGIVGLGLIGSSLALKLAEISMEKILASLI